MILLDTNVVSATMVPRPMSQVLSWLDRHPTGDLYLSTITIAEIRYGLFLLPEGRRRRVLEDRFSRFLDRGFEGRVLCFGSKAAEAYGVLVARRKTLGRPIGILDGQIAAIAKAERMALATRNTKDFESCGLDVHNPFVA